MLKVFVRVLGVVLVCAMAGSLTGSTQAVQTTKDASGELSRKIQINKITCDSNGYSYTGVVKVRAEVSRLPYGVKKKHRFYLEKELRWDRKKAGGWRNIDWVEYDSPIFRAKDVKPLKGKKFHTTVADRTRMIGSAYAPGRTSVQVKFTLKRVRKGKLPDKSIWKHKERIFPRWTACGGGFSPGESLMR